MHAFPTRPLTALKTVTRRGFARDAFRKAARVVTATIAVTGLTLASMQAHAEDALKFAIAPFLPEAELVEAYTPVAEHISRQIDQPVELQLFPSYLAFWEATRGGSEFDLALDSAPVTDFRIQRQGWRVIARFEGEVTQSLVTHEDDLIFSPDELVNKRVAVQPTPSVSALVLYQLFPNPVKQPKLVFHETNRDVAEAVLNGEVRAAVMPTPLVGGYGELNTVVTTDTLPFLAFSVSPEVHPNTADALESALVSFGQSDKGQEILESNNLTEIVRANDNLYRGHSELLEGTYGY
ncbi:MAG: phosphate/phosphite/phosphonate ABC transporter substrate-binding protein [Guyparkeria sp.]|uniref:phosphate/phosphite/phosphonate ABC transporter substrate-binding protein n=1 Tax=Guyparkeria sp. TaxID=2035736 RepID=UPI0039791709